MDAAQPENRTPLLLCEGTCEPGAVQPHTFVERRRRGRVVDETFTYDFIFECDWCGCRRAFGVESR
jgi:hypothetical protein